MKSSKGSPNSGALPEDSSLNPQHEEEEGQLEAAAGMTRQSCSK
jgi:hypothetical protein